MDEGCSCPICFCEYSSDGDHRIVAMKCGHLFGQSCLLGWFGSKKRAICPTCTLPSTKSQIRIIFANKISALGTENEQKLLDKFLVEHNEKNALLLENRKLKAQIDCLKIELENFTKEDDGISDFKFHSILFKKIKLQSNSKFSIPQIVFDDVRSVIVFGGFRNDSPVLYRYSSCTFDFVSVYTFSKDKQISNIISSPFKDGLVLLSIDKSVFLFNIYSFNIVYTHDIDSKITALSFNTNIRSAFYVADESGCVHFIDLDEKTIVKKKITDIAIHSICVIESMLYVASVFKIFEIDLETFISKNSEINIPRICTNMSTDGNLLLFTFRNENNTVGYLINETCSYYNPQYKQIRRHRDKIIDKYLYLVNDERYSLAVHDFRSFELIHNYEFDEIISDFYIGSTHSIILTSLYIYIYR
ncbi:ring finger and WD repeat domain-containing protein 3 [Nosema bombycis CQ1]|uniref:Ring finger and WD repeat domain-containing protein 3 n=1 Tax=Nosema bombycis (strain CQ1 / CVCC 102059) TaxID=578461 RepID=R0MQQ6_NOSB1|nr:ring finger and WD repeat domain-containing protein 3 [Nosema bombycis CQ1]|eukprot:EOB15228.1 ring finger and WD repeat domain-containing protein 3 [Nosema bombycis CQ1]